MDLSPKSPRCLCAEPLEGRWLLSGAAAADPSDTDAVPGSAVTVTDREQITEDEEETEVEIPLAQVPANVLAAFGAEFPDATIEEVELEEDDERGIEYGISAIDGGREIDITVSPQGQIVERETSIDLAEVPQAVIDKILEERPGAELESAADLGGGSYEVEFTAADGGEWEYELTVPNASPTAPPVDEAGESPALPSPPAAGPVGSASDTPDVLTDTGEPSAQHQQAVASAERTTTAAGAEAREDDDEAIEAARAAAEAAATTIPSILDERVTRALEALAAGTGAPVWLPDIAGALAAGLPIDIGALERELQEVLDELGALTANASAAAEASPITVGATRLAAAVMLVAAVKLLTHQARKPVGHSPIVFGPGNSTWGWVLGSSTTTAARPRRRRITLLRQHDNHTR